MADGVDRPSDEKVKQLNQYKYLVDNAPIALLEIDDARRIVTANQQCRALFGIPISFCINTDFFDYLSKSSQTEFLERFQKPVGGITPITIEATLLCPHAKNKNIQVFLYPASADPANGNTTVLALLDNTRQRTVEAQFESAKSYLQRVANNDALTGLSNRLSFKDNLRASMLSARKLNRNVALLYFDIDKFKNINDQFGHNVGDGLLREIANRLRNRTRDVGRLARVGGDEFTLTIECTNSIEKVVKEANHILAVIEKPLSIATHEFSVSSSIGISIYPGQALTPEDLINQADAAMYQSKANGGNCVSVFSKDLKHRLKRLEELEKGVKRGIEQAEFYLEYQPIVKGDTCELDSLEALIRWDHPSFGCLRPAEFISIAERSGKINDLGLWVIENTCKAIEKDFNQIERHRFAINLSPIQLEDTAIAHKIQKCADRFNIPPTQIEFEITESCIMQNLDNCLRLAAELNERGFSLSIDDFGTGYSSFSRLIDIPVSRLKLDRQLIKDIPVRSNALKIVKGMVGIAHDLGIKVVAEGVETQQQAAILSELNCDYLQGYYISAEIKSEGFKKYLGKSAEAKASQLVI